MEQKEHETQEELLLNPHAVKYTAEVHNALNPHHIILIKLAIEPDTFNSTEIPALSFKAMFTGQTPAMLTGGLLDTDLAAIQNWIYTHIPNAKTLHIEKMLEYTIAHARTLLLSHHHFQDFAKGAPKNNIESFVFQKAWK